MKTTSNRLAPTASLGLALSFVAFATTAFSANEPAGNISATSEPAAVNFPVSGLALAAAGVAPAQLNTSRDTYYLSDYLSTTIGTVDAAGEIDRMETDAFGAPLAAGRPAVRYTGKPYDEDMGAYIFPFRNYRPDEARWMTPDPSGFPDGTNNFCYSPNPTCDIDPYGLMTITGGSAPTTITASYGGTTYTVSATAAASIAASTLTFSNYTFTTGTWAGTINISTYSLAITSTAGGLEVPGTQGMYAKVTAGPTTGNHWIQIITTNDPLGGNPANTPYFDNNGQSKPFYDSYYTGDSTYFNDSPTRALSDLTASLPTITWSANMYYVHADGNAVTVYGGFSYSWTME